MPKKYLLLAILLAAAGCGKTILPMNNPPASPSSTPQTVQQATTTDKSPMPQPTITEPISGGVSRVTKKPFGIYVTPQNSPVSPEKFTGFHTGIDFETTPTEQNIDVAVYAICDGKLLMKKYATGYGGVAVESCTIDKNPVTVIYGHLRESSISPNIGQTLTAGQQIAVLGTGYSSETDGERKHLHLGIHKGTDINILGYVQKQSDLAAWIDPLLVLK